MDPCRESPRPTNVGDIESGINVTVKAKANSKRYSTVEMEGPSRYVEPQRSGMAPLTLSSGKEGKRSPGTASDQGKRRGIHESIGAFA